MKGILFLTYFSISTIFPSRIGRLSFALLFLVIFLLQLYLFLTIFFYSLVLPSPNKATIFPQMKTLTQPTSQSNTISPLSFDLHPIHLLAIMIKNISILFQHFHKVIFINKLDNKITSRFNIKETSSIHIKLSQSHEIPISILLKILYLVIY